MQEVKLNRLELLEKVEKNRSAHRDLFLKAQEGYREDVIAELDRMLHDAREGKGIRRSISLPEPMDHTKEYDRVIAMLKMSVDDTVVLESREFDQYVLDNWEWKNLATSTNRRYIKENMM